jgi:hypothetical protein
MENHSMIHLIKSKQSCVSVENYGRFDVSQSAGKCAQCATIDGCVSKVLVVTQRKRAMVNERPQQVGTTLETPRVPSGQSGQFRGILGRVIGQGIGLEPTPTVLHGVEFWRIGWQPLHMESTVTPYKGSDLGGPMRLQAIPDQQHVTSHLSAQLAEEGPHLGGIYIGRGMQPPAQPDAAASGADNQRGDHGDLLVVAGALDECGRLSAGTPRTAHHRRHQQAAFVQEHKRCVQPSGFFLIRRQSTLTQYWMSGSSRSRARRAGRCGLQPMERSNRPM